MDEKFDVLEVLYNISYEFCENYCKYPMLYNCEDEKVEITIEAEKMIEEKCLKCPMMQFK